MHFTDIQLYTSNKYINTKEEQHLYSNELKNNRYLMSYWENIRDLFSLNIPRKFDFIGVSKFNIRFGDFDGEPFSLDSGTGIATFRRNDFDIEDFNKKTEDQKNCISLYYLEDSLLAVCKISNLPSSKVQEIKRICSLIKEQNFEQVRLYKKATKWHSSRKFRALTSLHHKQGGINVSLAISDKKGNVLVEKIIIENEFWENVWFALWKGYWNETTFIVENKYGKELCRIQCP